MSRLRFASALLDTDQLRIGTRWRSRIRAKVLLYAEMNRQNDCYDGPGAKHQHHKENLDCHRETGYQNEDDADVIFEGAAQCRITAP